MEHTEANPTASVSAGVRLVAAAALAVVNGAVIWAIANAPAGVGLAAPVSAQLDRIGVGNPVTAVLLDLRAYDTLLEVIVLSLALTAVWSLRAPSYSLAGPANASLRSAGALLTPLMIIVSGYLLWRGGSSPGGAFQAGAVIASAGVLLLLSELPALHIRRLAIVRSGVAAGPIFFGGVGLGCMALGSRFLEYPHGWAKPLILVIEAISTVSIALVLVGVFASNPRVLTEAYDNEPPTGAS